MPKTASRPARAPKEAGHPDWNEILLNAVNTPGVISQAYSRFWNYSVGNQILALFQCHERGIELGPIHTFGGWLNLGRHVRKGEKAITLCMPVTVKRKLSKKALDSKPIRVGGGAERQVAENGESETVNTTAFTYKPHWFVLSQTDGEAYQPQEIPAWSEKSALHVLLIDRVPFHHADGNCQGYARERSVAISPIAALPHKTLFHELGHVVLGHTTEGGLLDDHERTPRSLREVEAECVALICCESLNLHGNAESRGYIQSWLSGEVIPERSARRIFKAADTILRAGRPASSESKPDSPE